jgi:nucleotide-binding universal stress UspA family protein
VGSVAQKIARHAAVPTLVLRSDGPNLMSATGDGKRSMRALAPLDGSPEAETALEPAARLVAALAAPGQGALHLLHVVQLEDTTDTAPNAKQSLQDEAEMYLRGVAERLTRAPLAGLSLMVTWSVICDPDAASAIIGAAEGEAANAGDRASAPPYDLIAMASHGRSGYELWAMGSVTERVLHTSALPLLIVSPATTQPDTLGADEGASGIEWMRDRQC